MMKSRIKQLAEAKGLNDSNELHYAAHISWPVAKKIWAGDFDLSNTRFDTARKVAAVLGCSMEELFVYQDE